MPTDLEQERELLCAERDAEICGIGYLVDGVRVSPERVKAFYGDRTALAASAAPQEPETMEEILRRERERPYAPVLPAEPTMPEDVRDALQESAYLAGLKRGWNLGIDEDRAGFERVQASREGYLKPLRDWQKAGRPGAAPQAGESTQAIEAALASLIDIAVPGLDTGSIVADAITAANAIREMRAAPQTGEDAQPILWLTPETYGRLIDGRTGKTVPAHVGRNRMARIPFYATPQPAAIAGEFLDDLKRSRTKYPGIARMFDGLMGEVDELRRAYNGDGDIRAEAFDVAVCAYRIATEGDDGGNTMLEQPAGRDAREALILAADHKGMRVDYSGLLMGAANSLALGHKETGLAEMLRQLQGHLAELGLRWYEGDTAVVDELLQLYCVSAETRAFLVTQKKEQPCAR